MRAWRLTLAVTVFLVLGMAGLAVHAGGERDQKAALYLTLLALMPHSVQLDEVVDQNGNELADAVIATAKASAGRELLFGVARMHLRPSDDGGLAQLGGVLPLRMTSVAADAQ